MACFSIRPSIAIIPEDSSLSFRTFFESEHQRLATYIQTDHSLIITFFPPSLPPSVPPPPSLPPSSSECLPRKACCRSVNQTLLTLQKGTCVCVCVPTCMCACLHACVCVHACVCACMHPYMCTCVRVGMHTCMCACRFMYACVHLTSLYTLLVKVTPPLFL